jgi:hypothetical protein
MTTCRGLGAGLDACFRAFAFTFFLWFLLFVFCFFVSTFLLLVYR